MIPLKERPIFIVGFPRSGTTLLRFILSSHPRIFIPAETGFIPFLKTKPKEHLSTAQVRSLLTRIGRLNRSWADMVENLSDFNRSLPDTTLKFILDALYRKKIVDNGASRWGDKTPTYILHLQTLLDIFPSAQFVHLIRDCRATTLSARRKWGSKNWYMDDYYLLKNWTVSVETGLTIGHRFSSSQYLEIRYEDLVQQPERVLETICFFLNEDFYPGMLDHTVLAHKLIGPDSHVEVLEPIHTDSLYHWKTQISPYTLKLANHLAGPTLSKLGYENVSVEPFTPAETARTTLLRVKYLFTDTFRKVLSTVGWLTPNRRNHRAR